MTEIPESPKGLAAILTALATYPPEVPCLIIVNYTYDRAQTWADNLARLPKEQEPLATFLKDNGGQIANGAGKVAMTLYGPPAMLEKLFNQPELLIGMRSVEEYYELKTNI
jgi:hypothetical protein